MGSVAKDDFAIDRSGESRGLLADRAFLLSARGEVVLLQLLLGTVVLFDL